MNDDLLAQVTRERDAAIAQRDALARQYDDNLSRLMSAEEQLGRCLCQPFPHGSGPEEDCGVHGRTYSEWVERGNILAARLAAVKEVIAKARRTPVANDPYRVALDIADDLEAAVYLEPETCPPDHERVVDAPTVAARAESESAAFIERRVAELRAILSGTPTEPTECCASGRCEVCSPGFDWGRDA